MEIRSDMFAAFATTPPARKVRLVREQRAQAAQPYSSVRDYWKRLRESLLTLHRENGTVTDLDALAEDLTNRCPTSKAENYKRAIEGYRDWWGEKNIRWEEKLAPRKLHLNGLDIRVSPHLNAEIDGVPCLIRYRFIKDEPTPAFWSDVTIHLLRSAYGNAKTACVLDVHRGILLSTPPPLDIAIWATGEAAAYLTMSHNLATEVENLHSAVQRVSRNRPNTGRQNQSLPRSSGKGRKGERASAPTLLS